MKVIQVVGYKNSGKTNTAEDLIRMIAGKGYRVASLKHHGHGGLPLGIEDTDSGRHAEAGAVIAGVEGENVLQLSSSSANWDVEQFISIYEFLEMDVLIIEGYKNHNYEKLVLLKQEEDMDLLKQVNNIKAVLTSFPMNTDMYSFPVFQKENREACLNWLIAESNL